MKMYNWLRFNVCKAHYYSWIYRKTLYYCGHGILDNLSFDWHKNVKQALGATNLTFDFCYFYHTDMPKINFQMSNGFKRQS
jgi:hypothetical protein